MVSNENIYKNLGKNIRNLRKAYGETQLDLALALDISTSAISQYETGARIPEHNILLLIAKHFRVPEHELLYGDFSRMKNISHTPIHDKSYNLSMWEKLPIICTPAARQNTTFENAYTLHIKLYQQLVDGLEVDLDSISECMELYKSALNAGIMEAAANRLWWYMVFGLTLSFLTPRLLDYLEQADTPSMKQLLQNGLLPGVEDIEVNATDDIALLRKEFLEKHEVNLLVDIYHLKHSAEYSDLGDFYLALRHISSLLSNELTPEMNVAIGMEMMCSFAIMGNSYAEKF